MAPERTYGNGESSTGPIATTPSGCAGEVTSLEAVAAMQREPGAVLVDCRTVAEWQFVGVPAIERVVFAEWVSFPDGAQNGDFLDQLSAAGITGEDPVYFLCRSGQRSLAAAREATTSGYRQAYNVSDGFEGPLGTDGQRNVTGWKESGLPWSQT